MPAGFDSSARRIRQILRFREGQHRLRAWISLWDIADWIACERGSQSLRDEDLRQQAYRDLLRALLIGEFQRFGTSFVLHLSPVPHARLRLTVDALRQQVEFYLDTDTVIEQVIPRCWVPRQLARQWFDRREIPWPEIFDPR